VLLNERPFVLKLPLCEAIHCIKTQGEKAVKSIDSYTSIIGAMIVMFYQLKTPGKK
jgi:hypothetical protein